MALSTTLAVQKCACVPVVKNSAPTVGTPLKYVGFGIPGGGAGVLAAPSGLACPVLAGPVLACCGLPGRAAGRPWPAGVALAIRAAVQNPRAPACAGLATGCSTAWVAAGPPAAPMVDAPAVLPAAPMVDAPAVLPAVARPAVAVRAPVMAAALSLARCCRSHVLICPSWCVLPEEKVEPSGIRYDVLWSEHVCQGRTPWRALLPLSNIRARALHAPAYRVHSQRYSLKIHPVGIGAPVGAPPASQQTHRGSAAPDPARP